MNPAHIVLIEDNPADVLLVKCPFRKAAFRTH